MEKPSLKQPGATASPKPLSTLFGCAVGLLFGVVLMFFDYPFGSFAEEGRRHFIRSYQFQLWILVIILHTTFWGAVCLPLWRSLLVLKSHLTRYWKGIMLWTLLFLVLLYSSSLLAPDCGDYGLPHSLLKTKILSLVGIMIALMAGIGFLLVNISLKIDFVNSEGDEKSIARYIDLRRYLMRLLTCLGFMTGLATLSVGAKRKAIFSDGPHVCIPDFSPERVLLVGLYYTVLLALVYFPTYITLLATGRKLTNDILPMPSPKDEAWASWYQRHKNLEKLLQLSLPETLRVGIAILTPLASSLISLLKI